MAIEGVCRKPMRSDPGNVGVIGTRARDSRFVFVGGVRTVIVGCFQARVRGGTSTSRESRNVEVSKANRSILSRRGICFAGIQPPFLRQLVRAA